MAGVDALLMKSLAERIDGLQKQVEDKKKPRAKRALTGYNLFVREMRKTAVKELGTGKHTPLAVMTKLGEMWKGLSEYNRKIWNEKARLECVVEEEIDITPREVIPFPAASREASSSSEEEESFGVERWSWKPPE